LFYTTVINIFLDDGPVRAAKYEFSVFKNIVVNLTTIECSFLLKLQELKAVTLREAVDFT